MRLVEIQRLFWRAITWPTGIDDFVAQADPDTRAAFEATFAQTPTFDRRQRMQVYAQAYFWRLFEVLRDQFPVTAWLCGSTHFHNLMTDYVWQHPSDDPDVRRFGRGLAAFFVEHPQAERIVGLPDVAAIEWAILDAVVAADEALLSADDLASIPARDWPTLRFVPTAATHLLPCRLPFTQLWRAQRDGETAPTPSQLEPTPHTVLVWRQPHDVYHRTVAPPEARALTKLLAGSTFAQICDAAAGPDGDAATPADVATWLRGWLEAGLVTRITSR